MCQRLNNPGQNKFAINIGQNGLHYMMGTFVYNFGGKLLNETSDRALYGEDAKSIQGAELDVDLHQRYRYTPTPEARATLPQGVAAFDAGMTAIDIDGLFRHTPARTAIGAENLDFAPRPRARGQQTAAVGGNGWAMANLSRAKEAPGAA